MSLSINNGNPPRETAEPEVAEKPEGAAPAAPGELEDLQAQLAQKTKEAQENYDRFLRLAAEMENLKKRSEKEKADLLLFSNEKLIKELLPVVDNLELALAHGREQDAPQALMEGLELVHQGFLKALERFGVTPLASLGEPFDPAFHNAVQEEENPEVKDCSVTQELQKGYLIHKRLLRPAMVVVARNPQKATCR
jgi:molecular chaperone GrpE